MIGGVSGRSEVVDEGVNITAMSVKKSDATCEGLVKRTACRVGCVSPGGVAVGVPRVGSKFGGGGTLSVIEFTCGVQ